jgi:hypothetical protein
MFRDFLARRTAKQFLRSPLGQLLHKHTREYFYTMSNLRHLPEDQKTQIINDFLARITGLFQTDNPFLKMREELAAAVYGYAELQVLCLKETERAENFYGHSPYVSGKLHYRVRECSPYNEDLKHFLWQRPHATDEELIDFANLKCCQYLYYLNGFNLVRSEFNDLSQHGRDWLRPFLTSMLISAEHTYREKIGMPTLLPGSLDHLKHSTFFNTVKRGTQDPLYDWESHYGLSHPTEVAGAST